MLEILQIPALSDNYIHLIHETRTGATAVVDPAEPGPVLDALQQRGWRLNLILNTHHHADHVGGNLSLKKATGCAVIGSLWDRSQARIPGIDRGIGEGELVEVGRAIARVISVPGHTLGHIAFEFPNDGLLFCGDTLFGMGCGRLFEGSAAQMWSSLQKLRRLSPATRVYCAHEYTEANGRFALTVDPDNPDLRARTEDVHAARMEGQPTVPFTLAAERATNPFLRPDSPGLRATLGLLDAEDVEVFAETRRRKDCFRG
jgi:hydroxyacylglutathione hydrolase